MWGKGLVSFSSERISRLPNIVYYNDCSSVCSWQLTTNVHLFLDRLAIVFMPILWYFEYYGLLLFNQLVYCFLLKIALTIWSLVIPYKCQSSFIHLCEKCHEHFHMDYVVALGQYGHLNTNISNPWAQDAFILNYVFTFFHLSCIVFSLQVIYLFC